MIIRYSDDVTWLHQIPSCNFLFFLEGCGRVNRTIGRRVSKLETYTVAELFSFKVLGPKCYCSQVNTIRSITFRREKGGEGESNNRAKCTKESIKSGNVQGVRAISYKVLGPTCSQVTHNAVSHSKELYGWGGGQN